MRGKLLVRRKGDYWGVVEEAGAGAEEWYDIWVIRVHLGSS